MRIKFVSFATSPYDKRAWSGTVAMMYKALKCAGAEVDYICCDAKPLWWHKLFCKFIYFLSIFTNKRYNYSNSFLWERTVEKKLEESDIDDCDFLLVPAYSVIASALSKVTCRPIVYCPDATYSGLENYYPEVRHLYSFSSRQANAISRKACEAAEIVIMPSNWARGHAIEDYGISPDKIHVIEFGANVENPHMGKMMPVYEGKKHFNILLSGVNWQRKGGDIAVECCSELIRRGFDIVLYVVGMNIPEKYRSCSFIKDCGYLNKNVSEQYKEYVNILRQTDILLFPTKAECAGIVSCEAAGFGIPVFSYDTGGVGNYVVNGTNGYRLEISATGKDFADAIQNAILSGTLPKLSRGSIEMYNSKLNWRKWADRVLAVLNEYR